MRKAFSFFLVFLSSMTLTAKVSKELPRASYFVAPRVNIITGEYIEQECDLVVAGANPLSFRRFFGTHSNFEGAFGGWRFNPEGFCVANFGCGAKERFVTLGDHNGNVLYCQELGVSQFGFKREKNYLYTHSDISGRAHPFNLRVSIQHSEASYGEDNKTFFRYQGEVVDGSGTKKTLRSEKFCWLSSQRYKNWSRDRPYEDFDKFYYAEPELWSPYKVPIAEERLPNGNILVYEYVWQSYTPSNYERPPYEEPADIKLRKIIAYNRDKTKVMGWLQWDEKDNHIDVLGSDGRSARLTYNCNNLAILRSVSTPNHPEIHYGNAIGGLDYSVERPDNRIFRTQLKEGKVVAQWAPIGPKDALERCFIYEYHPFNHHVIDAENNRTIYWVDQEQKIPTIQYFNGPAGYRYEVFVYDPQTGNLRIKYLQDVAQKTVFTDEYDYDERQNQTMHKRYDDKNSYTLYRTFSKDGFNLLLREWDDFGKDIQYSYVPDTNLVASEYVLEGDRVRKRTFHFYDDCAIEIKTVVDDGDARNCDDLSNVTYRRITEYTPRYQLPCFGLIEKKEEKTINDVGKEILLSKVLYSYTPFGKIAEEKHYDSSGTFCYTLVNTYDDRERLKSSTDPLGSTTFYNYDLNNNLYEVRRDQQYKKITYNAVNLPICLEELVDGVMLAQTMAYDKCGRIIEKVDECGHKTTYVYDGLGRCQQTTFPDTSTETKKYDIFDNVVEVTDAFGNTTFTEYDFQGNPTHVTHENGCEESFHYSPNGDLEWHIDGNGAKTTYFYDCFKHVVKQLTHGSDGTLLKESSATWSPFHQLSSTNPDGVTTFYIYDYAGRKIEERVGERVVTYGYDTLGRQNKTESFGVVTLHEFDFLNQITKTTIKTPSDTLLRWEGYEYDTGGHRTKVITSKSVTETKYNQRGLPILQIDPLGHETHISYSYKDNLIATAVDPLGVKTISTYDWRGNCMELEKKNASQKLLQKTTRHFDLNGNLEKERLCVVVDGIQQSVIEHRWSYEKGHQLKSLCEGGNKTTFYAYDERGRLKTLTKPSGTKLCRSYDELGRLKRYYGPDFDYLYTYDASDRVLLVEDTFANTKLTREYDFYGYLKRDQHILYANDLWGRCVQMTLPDASTIEYTYIGKDIKSVYRNGLTAAYERDLEGEIKTITTAGLLTTIKRDALKRYEHLSTPHYESHYRYDKVGNLEQWEYSDPLGASIEHYRYDDLNQLTEENHHRYLFDSLYNCRQKDDKTFSFNSLCQCTDSSYDGDGNLKSDGVRTFEYDTQDRLIKVSQGDQHIHYTYDCFHRRLSKTTPHQSLNYLWSGNNEIGAMQKNIITELRILGTGLGAEIGAAVFIELQGIPYIPLHDHRGSLAVLLNSQGSVVDTYRYTTFGELLAGHLSPWQFSSKRHDPETDLLFFGRRYYSPQLQRWLTPDPQGLKDGPNLYCYLHNNPLTSCDLYGLWDFSFKNTRSMGDFLSRINRSLFSLVELTGMHLIPVAGIRDVVEAVGRWGTGGKFFELAAYRTNCNCIVRGLGQIDTPGSSIADMNGLNVSLAEAKTSALTKSAECFQDKKVDLLYNGSQGFLTDLFVTILAKFGISSAYERMVAHYFTETLAKNPDHQFLVIAHSQAGTHLMNASKLLKEGPLDRMYVKTFGSATIIPRGIFRDAKNYVSKLDLVPWTSLNMLGGNCDVTFLSPTSYSPLAEHAILGETYKRVLTELGKEFMRTDLNVQ